VPLDTPPRLRIGTTWHQTEWDPDTSTGEVERGARQITAREVAYLHGTARLGDEPAQVWRLLVAGESRANPPAQAVVLPVGRHRCVQELADTPEVRESREVVFTVTA
jgi:hypothetical protein